MYSKILVNRYNELLKIKDSPGTKQLIFEQLVAYKLKANLLYDLPSETCEFEREISAVGKKGKIFKIIYDEESIESSRYVNFFMKNYGLKCELIVNPEARLPSTISTKLVSRIPCDFLELEPVIDLNYAEKKYDLIYENYSRAMIKRGPGIYKTFSMLSNERIIAEHISKMYTENDKFLILAEEEIVYEYVDILREIFGERRVTINDCQNECDEEVNICVTQYEGFQYINFGAYNYIYVDNLDIAEEKCNVEEWKMLWPKSFRFSETISEIEAVYSCTIDQMIKSNLAIDFNIEAHLTDNIDENTTKIIMNNNPDYRLFKNNCKIYVDSDNDFLSDLYSITKIGGSRTVARIILILSYDNYKQLLRVFTQYIPDRKLIIMPQNFELMKDEFRYEDLCKVILKSYDEFNQLDRLSITYDYLQSYWNTFKRIPAREEIFEGKHVGYIYYNTKNSSDGEFKEKILSMFGSVREFQFNENILKIFEEFKLEHGGKLPLPEETYYDFPIGKYFEIIKRDNTFGLKRQLRELFGSYGTGDGKMTPLCFSRLLSRFGKVPKLNDKFEGFEIGKLFDDFMNKKSKHVVDQLKKIIKAFPPSESDSEPDSEPDYEPNPKPVQKSKKIGWLWL